MPSAFLPLVEADTPLALRLAVTRIGPILISPEDNGSKPAHYSVLAPSSTLDEIIAILDGGAEQVVVSSALAKDAAGVVPPERLLLLLDVNSVSTVPDKVRTSVSGAVLKVTSIDVDFISTLRNFFSSDKQIYVWSTSAADATATTVAAVLRAKATIILPSSHLTLSQSLEGELNIADAFLAPLTSDRPDGLFPTVVSAFNQSGKALGLVYSSKQSIAESIRTGKGVYQSRKHGLWRKGETSGATQDVVSIRADCDWDSLEFQVIQHGTGFCHTGCASCFGELTGRAKLEQTLKSRRQSAPEGSYTHRLFNDAALLKSKILEEATELCDAKTPDEVAFEAADLLYFTLTLCTSKGVSVTDIEASLDKKSKKITRRPGNAKPQFTAAVAQTKTESTTSTIDGNDAIKMRSADLSTASASERTLLLRRPVLRSDEMITKVKPIIDSVRKGGDAALKQLTAKFDKATLQSNIVRAPFPPESMILDEKVRSAIDSAYQNVYKFHAAQAEKEPMVVETMPGVVCSRFARPIARVGLYVPGGTAVLPSTALMLGIPAQVAGCKEIVMAVPPRPDGSVVPEVMYAAKLVGASAVLKAGGAQAIAAMAYGTETVPKVDKIFGPGNQWVTAAKMAVQNDTDALVSIDMPAGPSEVLVRKLSSTSMEEEN